MPAYLQLENYGLLSPALSSFGEEREKNGAGVWVYRCTPRQGRSSLFVRVAIRLSLKPRFSQKTEVEFLRGRSVSVLGHSNVEYTSVLKL
jgi:hypothetical protein